MLCNVDPVPSISASAEQSDGVARHARSECQSVLHIAALPIGVHIGDTLASYHQRQSCRHVGVKLKCDPSTKSIVESPKRAPLARLVRRRCAVTGGPNLAFSS